MSYFPFVLTFTMITLASPTVGQEIGLRRTFTIEVPARGLTGPRPERKIEVEFKLPAGFEVQRSQGRQGLVEIDKKHDGLDQEQDRVDPINGGVKIDWRLKNPNPLQNLKGSLAVELRGRPTEQPSLSPKYHALRTRFLDTFYHQGRVAVWVDPVQGKKINFGDQNIYMGHALMVFSTEMAILRKLGQPTDDPKKLIIEILDAFDELDLKAEGRYDALMQALNGFAVRDDITGKEDSRLKTRYLEVESDWQNPDDASPSGDQIFGMMCGLSCVVRYSGDGQLSKRAKETSRRLFDYAKRNNFMLRLPDGKKVKRGADMRWLATLLHGLNKEITGDDNFANSRITVAGQKLPLNSIGAFWDSRGAKQAAANLVDLQVPSIGRFPFHAFAIHIMLTAMAPCNVWSQDEIEAVAIKANHHLAILWYCQTHGRLPQAFTQDDIQKMLDQCPDTGPHGGLSAESGWNKDSRWIRCRNIHEPPTNNHLHNGLDWLLLHNLNELVYKL